MRQSVLGFNQSKAIQSNLDLTDLLLLQYIMLANGTPSMKHLVKDDVSYVWLSHSKIHEDLPILDITEGTLRNRLMILKKTGWIMSETLQTANGTNTYYSVTIKTISLINDTEVETDEPCHSKMTRPCHSKMTSDNKLEDNKLNSNFTNVKLEQATPTPKPLIQTETSNDIATTTSNISNKKKKNRWEQCVDEINNFTDNEELRSVLTTYLKMRLEMTPIFRGQWLGLLNNLKKLSGDTATQIEIVQQSINRGYKGFFEVKQYKKYGGQDKSVFSEYGQVKSVHKNEEIVNVQF